MTSGKESMCKYFSQANKQKARKYLILWNNNNKNPEKTSPEYFCKLFYFFSILYFYFYSTFQLIAEDK